MERLKLLEILPEEDKIINLKIIRKFRETLSFNENEIKLLVIRYEYVCTHQNLDTQGNLISLCENKGFYPEPVKCAAHDEMMVPTGSMRILNNMVMHETVKEIHIGPEALSIAVRVLKRLDSICQLRDEHLSLCEKFCPEMATDMIVEGD